MIREFGMRTDHSEPTVRHRTLLMTLLLGVGLLWPLPLGGVFLMVAASFGLVVAWEPELTGAVMTPALTPVVPGALGADPSAPGSS
jgi:hypothetical protein